AVRQEEIPLLVEVADVTDRTRLAVVPACARRLLGVGAVLENSHTGEPDRPRRPSRALLPVVVEDVDLAQDGPADAAPVCEPVLGRDEGAAVALGGRVVLEQDRPEPLD